MFCKHLRQRCVFMSLMQLRKMISCIQFVIAGELTQLFCTTGILHFFKKWHNLLLFWCQYTACMQNTMAARSKAWTVFARLNTVIVGSNPSQVTVVCVLLFFSYVVLCVGSGLTTGWFPPSKKTYWLYIRPYIKKLKKRPRSTRAWKLCVQYISCRPHHSLSG
jgi:hypothetical protein